MSFLPYPTSVDPHKIAYLVSSGKAGFFIQHGFDPQRNPNELSAALRNHPIRNHIENTFATGHGIKYTVRCTLESPDGRHPCTFTVWIVDKGTQVARFVTGYASAP